MVCKMGQYSKVLSSTNSKPHFEKTLPKTITSVGGNRTKDHSCKTDKWDYVDFAHFGYRLFSGMNIFEIFLV